MSEQQTVTIDPTGGFVSQVAVLANRAAAAEGKRPTFEEYMGVPYVVTQAGITDLRKVRPHAPTLGLTTLQGLADYLTSALDGDMGSAPRLALHVVSQTEVRLIGGVDQPNEGDELAILPSRPVIAAAVCQPPMSVFAFGKYYDPESFVVNLLTLFGDAGNRAGVLRLIGNLRDENVRTVADDGVTQVVTARAGVALVSEVSVPNPVQLAPFRSFVEIMPIPTSFLLRVRRGDTAGALPTVALFEADGGAWAQATVLAIKDWLLEHVKGVAVLA